MSEGELCNAKMTMGKQVFFCKKYVHEKGKHTAHETIINEHGKGLGCSIEWPNFDKEGNCNNS